MGLPSGVGFVAPLLAALAIQSLNFGRVSHHEFEAGRTPMADLSKYNNVFMTKDELRSYFRDGFVVVRNVMRPDVLQELYKAFPEAQRKSGRFSNGYHMQNPDVFDFLTYSNLGHLASQVFAAESTETAPSPGTIHIWKAFFNSRSNVSRSKWHVDRMECAGDLPANYTARARVRFLIPLNGDLSGTLIVNQSKYALDMTEEERSRYWRGEIPVRLNMDVWATLPAPKLNNLVVSQSSVLQVDRVHVGDAIVINPCAWHTAPFYEELTTDGLPVLILQPSYAAAKSKMDTPYGYKSGEIGDCLHGLEVDQTVQNSKCFPQSYPESGRPVPGTKMTFERIRW